MANDDQRRKASQFKVVTSLVLVSIFGLAIIIGQKLFFAKVEESGKPAFQGKLERSRIPVTLPTDSPEEKSEPVQPSRIEPKVRSDAQRPEPPPSDEPSVDVAASPKPVPDAETKVSSRLAESRVPVNSIGIAKATVIHGRVTLSGTPPAEKPVEALVNDPVCGKLLTNMPTTRFFVVGDDNGLGDVFVYVKEGVRGIPKVQRKGVLIDQKACEYTPYISGVQAGDTVFVRNSDPTLHNVHPTPNAPGNKEKNLAQMPKAADLQFVFEKPELFLRFKCDIHPWMFAYVSVVEHPYFAVTQPDGSFSIEGLPPGDYVIEAVHRKAGRATRQVEIRRGVQAVTANFELAVAAQ